MSLTTFIRKSEINHIIREYFTKVKIPKADSIVQPRGGRNDLIGIAFDYLMRFFIKRLNKEKCIERNWTAENLSISLPSLSAGTMTNSIDAIKCLDFIDETINSAKSEEQQYILSGVIKKDLLKYCFRLAQFDLILRSGIFLGYFKDIPDEDIDELNNLYLLLDGKIFIANKNIFLNPVFGQASIAIGGADADLIIDNTIIEIKTVKDFTRVQEYIDQLIGYYVLSRITSDKFIKKNVIDSIGIYFSRHGKYYVFKIDELINNEKQISDFIEWFKGEIKRY